MAEKIETPGGTPAPMDTQDFDMAFAALAGDDGAPSKDPTEPAQPATPPETPPVTDPPTDDEAAKAAEAEAAKAKADAEAEAARVADQARVDAEKAAEAERAKAEADAAKAAEAAKASEGLAARTAELQKKIDEVAKDFPEMADALIEVRRTEEELRKATLAEAQAAFRSELEALKKDLAPVFATTQSVAKSSFESAVLSKHADAKELLPDLAKWVDTQPKFLQGVYNRVLDGPTTVEETVELISIFKAATGRNVDSAAADAAKAAEAKAEEERQRKLAAQEGVRGRQTQRKETLDPNDFDGAFDKFAASA